MIDVSTIPDAELGQTIGLMKAEVMRRGWRMQILYPGSPHCYIDRGDGKSLHVVSSTPPTTSYAAAYLANNKFAAYMAFRDAGIPQQETYLVDNATPFETSLNYMRRMEKVVVKPVDGGHGRGITVNVTTDEEMRQALDVAMEAAKVSSNDVIIQTQYSHDAIYDIRILCIDYKYVAGIWRMPARVWGDGVHTVRQLIESENATEHRGKPYFAKLATIDVEKAEEYLNERIDNVPAASEEILVLGVANYGAVGETIDITDDLPLWLIEIAEKAATICELPLAGVDFMISGAPNTNASMEDLNAVVIEINKCPSLAIHDSPTSGLSRPAVSRYMDYLAQI